MSEFPPADAPCAPSSSQLAVRYQRLVLINRMSSALFGDRPFASALSDAGHAAMALMGAQSVAIYFVDELGRPVSVHRHADKRLSDETAQAAERALLARAFADKRIITNAIGGRSWEAVPLLRVTPDEAAVTGGVVFGHTKETALDMEREGALVDIARQLRNARLMQQTLQRKKISAAIVDQTSDAIFLTDLDAKIMTWNQGAEKLFLWRADEVLGRHGAFLVPPERKTEVSKLIADVLEEGHKVAVETVRLRKDGTLIEIEGSFTLLKDDENAPFAIVRAYRDITKRKKVERLKNELVALVSHELRTPLTAIYGFAETLSNSSDELTSDTRRHYLQIMLDESKRLSRMVVDFLDIARTESGDIEPILAEVNISALLERIAQLFKEHLPKPRFAVVIEPGAEAMRGDEEQLYRLLVNLVGNALKYTPPGGTVTLAAAPAGDDVELSVSDQGPGVSKKDQARLFEKFFRADDAITRKTPGTGLGLAICKGIVQAHAGRIQVDSEPGRGARFIARLPKTGPAARSRTS